MGIRLIVEVMDHWQDAGLTVGERDDLLVLAENANDQTRTTWGSVHAPYILRRANKGAAGWKNAIGKLARKGLLAQQTPGRVGQVAVYRLVSLCREAPHDGFQGSCTRSERVTSQVTHRLEEGHFSGDPLEDKGHLLDDPQGHSTGDPLGREGHLTGDERVTWEVTPTPLYPSSNTPSTTPSSSVAEVGALAIAGRGVEEGDRGNLSSVARAEPLVDALDYRGRPPGRSQRDKLIARVAAALGAGWAEGDLKTYLDLGTAAVRSAVAVYLHRLAEGELPDATAWSARQSPVLAGTDSTVAGWLALAADGLPESRGAAPGGHRPYSNSVWWEPASPEEATRVPHCGDLECDEVTRLREDRDHRGLPVLSLCPRCHPSMQL